MGGRPDDGANSAADALSAQLSAIGLNEQNGPRQQQFLPPQQQQQQSQQPPLVAGLEGPLQQLRELIVWPARYAAEAAALGVEWPAGVLLHGPPGCGKTALVRQVAAEANAKLHVVGAGDVFGAYVGESERRLREAFAAAAADAAAGSPSVVFLDEADALAPRRRGGADHEARVVAQLLALLDGAAAGPEQQQHAPQQQAPQKGGGAAPAPARVVVVAATNRPNALDPALRRPGRLDREVAVPVPGPDARAAILRLHTKGLPLAPDVDIADLAAGCHGYSGADLAALAREAAAAALATAAAAADCDGADDDDTADGQAPPAALVTAADFAAALGRVGPSIVRGIAVADSRGSGGGSKRVTWDDIGGYEDAKRRLRQAVTWPLRHAAAFARLGLAPPRGALLHGPPGCSKTLLARAAAADSGATLLPLSCAALYSMYVGDGEAALRDVFARARMAAPSIVFLDEADAAAPARGGGDGDGSGSGGAPGSAARLLSALLTEVDGLEGSPGVLLLAATNRPAALDPALLRPGRLDVHIYVPPPDAAARLAALNIHTRGMPLAADVDLAAVAAGTEGFTGAEVAALAREAALAALREDVDSASQVAARHFAAARAAMAPALTAAELAAYAAWGRAYAR